MLPFQSPWKTGKFTWIKTRTSSKSKILSDRFVLAEMGRFLLSSSSLLSGTHSMSCKKHHKGEGYGPRASGNITVGRGHPTQTNSSCRGQMPLGTSWQWQQNWTQGSTSKAASDHNVSSRFPHCPAGFQMKLQMPDPYQIFSMVKQTSQGSPCQYTHCICDSLWICSPRISIRSW